LPNRPIDDTRGVLGIQPSMAAKLSPPRTLPDESSDENYSEEEIVNDSLGTIDPADSTGSDEDKETGDAKVLNWNTRED
jgi:hypothetical protein